MDNEKRNIDSIILPFRDDANLIYAAKNLVDSGLAFHGDVFLKHYRGGNLIHEQVGSNIFTTEGRNHLLEVIFGATARDAAMYVGIFKSNQTPAAGDTAAAKLGAAGTYSECQDADYTPNTNKPVYTIAAAASSICTNVASPAVFTIVAASITLYGAFLSTAIAKTATTGFLMCAKAFSPSRAVITADVISVVYVITATSS